MQSKIEDTSAGVLPPHATRINDLVYDHHI